MKIKLIKILSPTKNNLLIFSTFKKILHYNTNNNLKQLIQYTPEFFFSETLLQIYNEKNSLKKEDENKNFTFNSKSLKLNCKVTPSLPLHTK